MRQLADRASIRRSYRQDAYTIAMVAHRSIFGTRLARKLIVSTRRLAGMRAQSGHRRRIQRRSAPQRDLRPGAAHDAGGVPGCHKKDELLH
jgi:hypothetical protein